MNELDPLTRLVSLGTARAPDASLLEDVGGVEARTLHALAGLSLEKRLLLTAGVRAVARAAGGQSRPLDAPPEPVPEETLRPCPPGLEAPLGALLDGSHPERDEALDEVYRRMATARYRLPPRLLVRALSNRGTDRALLEPVLGERGRWLARRNSNWSAPARPRGDDVERLWTEGSFDERRTALEELRGVDPARARQWLQDTWKQEKAEHRARLLACFDPTLSPEDEPVLEQGRQDRSVMVREVARHLLARLPDSAFSRRMRERAFQVLRWEAGALHVELPARWDAEAERDGLDKPPAGTGRGEYWLVRILECVPLPEWEKHFGVPPEPLADAAARSEEYVALSEGWTQAFRLGTSSRWATALMATWGRSITAQTPDAPRLGALSLTVFEQLPAAESLARLLAVIRGEVVLPFIYEAMAYAPTPWPDELGRWWLRQLYEFPSSAGSLARAVGALSPACLRLAAEAPPLSPQLAGYRDFFDQFQQLVSLFRILHEELKP